MINFILKQLEALAAFVFFTIWIGLTSAITVAFFSVVDKWEFISGVFDSVGMLGFMGFIVSLIIGYVTAVLTTGSVFLLFGIHERLSDISHKLDRMKLSSDGYVGVQVTGATQPFFMKNETADDIEATIS